MKKQRLIGTAALALLLIGCGGLKLIASPTPSLPTQTAPPWPTGPFDLAQDKPATITPIFFPTHTATVPPTETPVPTFTFTPTLTLTPGPVMQGPGNIIVPILLYHHIGSSLQGETVYYVSPQAFEHQMNLLYQWGYKTISVELLVRAITAGAELPPKPVILTFDDGSESTYTTALPLMQRYGFTGVAFIVHNYVGIPGYMDKEQIRALHAAGWEIGSHGLSHVDLTVRTDRQGEEIVESRRKLRAFLGIPVSSFAYPFGAYNDDSLKFVHHAGYTAAMGLGNETLQRKENLFYLYRQPVKGTDDLQTFSLVLPWRGDLENLPALTIVP